MGEVLAGLETEESTHLSPSPATHEASMAPFQGRGPCPCRTRCFTPRVRLFSSHWTVSPAEYKQGQGWVHPDLSLSHFNDWTGLSEGCAYYCRRWASLIPLLIERLSKCILLFAKNDSETEDPPSRLVSLDLLKTSGELALGISLRAEHTHVLSDA